MSRSTTKDVRTNATVESGEDVEQTASDLPADPDPAGAEPEAAADKSRERPYTVLERITPDGIRGAELDQAIADGLVFVVRQEGVVAANDRTAIIRATAEDEHGHFVAKTSWKVREVGEPKRKPSRVVR